MVRILRWKYEKERSMSKMHELFWNMDHKAPAFLVYTGTHRHSSSQKLWKVMANLAALSGAKWRWLKRRRKLYICLLTDCSHWYNLCNARSTCARKNVVTFWTNAAILVWTRLVLKSSSIQNMYLLYLPEANLIQLDCQLSKMRLNKHSISGVLL